MGKEDRFLNACRLKPVDTTPVWLMRQAGRYMAEYRALRERYTILEMIKNPELAVEVTLQPVRAFDIDAAIIFADILPVLESMGMGLEFVKGEGPVLHHAVRSAEDVNRLTVTDPEDTLSFTLDAIRLARAELDGHLPLIGFSGAPFTLACYAIEGGSSRTFEKTRAFSRSEPEAWRTLMEKIAQVVAAYLKAQVAAGAQALQLFDSWAKALSVDEYLELAAPYSRQVFTKLGETNTPIIHFSTAPLDLVLELSKTGGDVIGLAPELPLGAAWEKIGYDKGIQGNLDPDLLADGPIEKIQQEAARILQEANRRPGHIFNLGHGVLKHTPEGHVRDLVDFVHGHRYEAND